VLSEVLLLAREQRNKSLAYMAKTENAKVIGADENSPAVDWITHYFNCRKLFGWGCVNVARDFDSDFRTLRAAACIHSGGFGNGNPASGKMAGEEIWSLRYNLWLS
jgi:hypothetical protein